MIARSVIVSPHLDDAFLSLGGALLSGVLDACVIVNVFSTSDNTRFGTGDLEEVTARRRSEDGRVFADLSPQRIYLDWPDWPLRFTLPRPRDEDVANVVSAACRVANAAFVLLPASIGQHPDHDFTRQLDRCLSDSGWMVGYYADLPYEQPQCPPGFVASGLRHREDDADEKARRLLLYSSQIAAAYVAADYRRSQRQGFVETVFVPVGSDS
ncbi:PIG-L family deacetylase [Gordonia alkanivorans]|uniref:Uncharacterized protein n=1 Tax=Gordonia alkanivorans NBRC 16433 TaxID=1027371 RepID=F9W269_9ACTN|nr:PIG-L family deacetylase [Gordonia alkanivorans]GAA14958.1 hypothetical protein GOALK_120_00150 [Gordonia alkanivorans NBRC 16433]